MLVVGSVSAGAQSLVDVAKAEEARRKTVDKPPRSTQRGSRSDFTTHCPVPAGAQCAIRPRRPRRHRPPMLQRRAKPAAAEPATPQRDQAYWKGRITDARTALDRSKDVRGGPPEPNQRADYAGDQSRRSYQQRALEQDRQKNLVELTRVTREIETQTKAIASIEDEARRRCAAGWLR